MSNKTDWQNLFYELLEEISLVENYSAMHISRKYMDLATDLELK